MKEVFSVHGPFYFVSFIRIFIAGITIYGIMKRFCLFCLCLLGFSVWGASAQVVEKVLDIFGADSLPGSNVAVTADSDSVHLSTVKKGTGGCPVE